MPFSFGCDMGSGRTESLSYCSTVLLASVFTVLRSTAFTVFLICGKTAFRLTG